jgi:hypothetical protein
LAQQTQSRTLRVERIKKQRQWKRTSDHKAKAARDVKEAADPELRVARLKKLAERSNTWRIKNSEHYKVWHKEYVAIHKGHIADKQREYFAAHPGYQAKWGKNERKTNPQFNLACKLRSRLLSCLKGRGAKKTDKTEKLLGCSWKHAVFHLESNVRGLKLTDKGIHIDHVRPMASFKNLHCEFEQRTVNHWLNLQLLPAKENLRKNAKFDYDSWAASDAGKQLLELNREWRMERYFQ